MPFPNKFASVNYAKTIHGASGYRTRRKKFHFLYGAENFEGVTYGSTRGRGGVRPPPPVGAGAVRPT